MSEFFYKTLLLVLAAGICISATAVSLCSYFAGLNINPYFMLLWLLACMVDVTDRVYS